MKHSYKIALNVALNLLSISEGYQAQAQNDKQLMVIPTSTVSYPLKNGHILVPKLRKDIAEEFEGSNLIKPEVFKHPEDKIQKDLKSPPTGEEKQNKFDSDKYSKFKNEIINKYKRQIPELAQLMNTSKPKTHTPGLADQAKKFSDVCEAMKKEAEENDKKINDFKKGVVDTVDIIAEKAIENGVKDQEIKSALVKIKSHIKQKISSFLK